MAVTARPLLIASLVLNVFLIGAGVSAAVYGQKYLHDRSMLRPPSPLSLAARNLPQPVRSALKQRMRAEALTVRPDFVAAREARLQAAAMAAAPNFDRAAVLAKLAEARADETRARIALETTLIDFMAAMSPADRATLAPALKPRPPRPHRRGSDGGPPPDGSPPH